MAPWNGSNYVSHNLSSCFLCAATICNHSLQKPVASLSQLLMLSCSSKLLRPMLQLVHQFTLVFSQHCLHRKEMLLQTIDQRNWKLLVHHFLLGNNYQPNKYDNQNPVSLTNSITRPCLAYENNKNIENVNYVVSVFA